MTRCIDADSLKYHACYDTKCDNGLDVKCQSCGHSIIYKYEVDNASTVKIDTNDIEYEAYCRGLEDGKKIARPTGKWIFDSEFTVFGTPYGSYKCSICGGHSSNKYSFCKDCGARMVAEPKISNE